jgi:hypoxanthine phosphoribosyltransferase
MPDNLKLIIEPEEIRLMVKRIAEEIRTAYASRNPVLVGALKGAAIFLSDLVRAIGIPLEVDFIQTSSYGRRGSPSGDVLITRDTSTELKGRDVIIVEGIVDSGRTATAITGFLKKKGPASISLCTLLLRDDARTGNLNIDYVGKVIPGGFIVGYGMDYKEGYRWLDGIYRLTKSAQSP